MTKAVTRSETPGAPALDLDTLFSLVINGDLSKLNPAQKVDYYRQMCERAGLDPATQPFKLLNLQGKEVLYCDRSGTAQLNRLHGISHEIKERLLDADSYVVTARAIHRDGRFSDSLGAVPFVYPDRYQVYDTTQRQRVWKDHPKAGKQLTGEDRTNAMMKAETKAKRRSTLDLVGLGIIDDVEVDSVDGATRINDELDKTEAVRMRFLRGELNQALLVGRDLPLKEDEALFKKACMRFQQAHGKVIWDIRTRHNERETFESLADAHKQRLVDKQEQINRPDVRADFLARLQACVDPIIFDELSTELDETLSLRDDPEVVEALRNRGREDFGATYMEDFDGLDLMQEAPQ